MCVTLFSPCNLCMGYFIDVWTQFFSSCKNKILWRSCVELTRITWHGVWSQRNSMHFHFHSIHLSFCRKLFWYANRYANRPWRHHQTLFCMWICYFPLKKNFICRVILLLYIWARARTFSSLYNTRMHTLLSLTYWHAGHTLRPRPKPQNMTAQLVCNVFRPCKWHCSVHNLKREPREKSNDSRL